MRTLGVGGLQGERGAQSILPVLFEDHNRPKEPSRFVDGISLRGKRPFRNKGHCLFGPRGLAVAERIERNAELGLKILVFSYCDPVLARHASHHPAM